MSLPTPIITDRAWTAEQAEAIERRDGELLLDAAAGSGKTSVLVERFVRHVLEDGIAVSAILAITFTEKAAAELRDRIRHRLHELGAPEQARATEGAFISTIHGFCARVLRSGALAAGLDPGFVVLNRDQSEPLAREAFEGALESLAPAQAVELLATFGAAPLRHAIISVYASLRSGGLLAPRLPAIGPLPGPEVTDALESAIRLVAAELDQIADPGASVTQAMSRLERCRELLSVPHLWPARLDAVRLPGSGAALSTDACLAYKEALGAYRAARAAQAAGPVREQLDDLLSAFGNEYASRKRAVAGVDFEDLELFALELLRSRPELRQGYGERFERIMVDEQQDTNRVQLELIESIARANLFTVGDAQQSIYRFRHADVGLFQRRGERLGARGSRLSLQTNFRSRPEVLAAINHAFANALGERFSALVAGRPAGEDDGREPRVELLLVDKGAEWELEGLAAPWRLAEAQALADRLAGLVAQGTAPSDVVVLTRATTDMRAYERALEGRGLPTYVIGGRGYWSHPQVLDLLAYLRALANPLDEESLYAVLASPLVRASFDALVLLGGAARARRTDPWSLLAEPRTELAELGPDDAAALTGFASWFAAERASVPRLGIEDLIDRVLEQTGYDAAMLAMPGGPRRLANVRKLMRLGREFEREHGPDLAGFLAAVADRAAGRAADARESEAPVEGDGLQAIRLMTIHRAKGLEWPTVCVADLGRSPRPQHQILRVSADGRLGLRLSRPGLAGRVSALDYDAIGGEEKRAEEDEERRLFYVAMTRARERLILSGATRFDGWTGAANSTGGGPAAWIAPALVSDLGRVIVQGGGVVRCGTGSIRVGITAPETLTSAPGSASAPPPATPPPTGSGVAPVAPVIAPPSGAPPPAPLVSTLSYSSLEAHARCGYRFYAEKVLGLPEITEAAADAGGKDAETARGRAAVERGVLLHALLERLSFRRPVVPEFEAVAAAAAAAGLSRPSPAEAAALGALIDGFARSPLRARLAGVLDTRREGRFAFPLQAGVLITGAVDVLAREPGGRVLIVDYKSDRLAGADPGQLAQRLYGTQRLVYGLAALHGGADSVEVAHCFLESPEDAPAVVYTRADRSALEAELGQLAQGIMRQEFRVSGTPHRGLCAGCPAEDGLCSWPLAMTRRPAADRLF